jgi:RNA polymerase sigma factor (sigma-70 family)
MATAQLGTLMQHIQGLAAGPGGQHRTDRQLLDDFASGRDDSAFAGLVGRHGPMVLRVCRRVLRHEQDAEDAFQATFLVLARNPGAIRKGASLASWLYGVAYRTALAARRKAGRRRNYEARLRPRTPSTPSPTWDDVQAVLDEEIQRLPESLRAAFVMCAVHGQTLAAAAAELGIKEGTVGWRLSRARQRLGSHLARRGIQLSAVPAALAVASSAGEAAVPAALAGTTIRFGLSVAAGEPAAAIPSHVAALAAGVTRAMTLTKAKFAASFLVAVGLLVAAGGALAYRAFASGEEPSPNPSRPAEPPTPRANAAPPAARPDDADVPATFSGRVLDPDSHPVRGVRVVFHQRRPYGELPDFFSGPVVGTTDAAGRYRFSGTIHRNAPGRDRKPQLTLTAHVPGYGPAATVEVHSPDELKDRTLRLVKDDVPLRGRILDLQGKPVPGVTVRPVAVVANAANDLGRLVKVIETTNAWWAELPDEHRPNIVFSAPAAGLTQTAVTDGEGRFTLSGFGRERIVVLRLDGPAIATSLLNAMTSARPAVRSTRPERKPDFSVHNVNYVFAHGASFDYVAGSPVVVEGTVRDQDTGKALAGVGVRYPIDYNAARFGWADEELTTTTDAAGQYRLAGVSRPSPYAHHVDFAPPAGQPYLAAVLSPPESKLGQPVRLDVGLKQGVLVKGRVTDKVTGRPVQAVVAYFAFADNPNVEKVKHGWSSRVVSSKKDGSFTLAALPGRGIVAARTDDMRRGAYLFGKGASAIAGLDARMGGMFMTRPYICKPGKFDALAAIEPGANIDSVDCDLQLDPGKTVKGTLRDPDGKPLAGVHIRGPFWSQVSIPDLPSEAFTIAAVDAERPQAYFFEHPGKKFAAAVILKGDEPEGFPLKLKPTATVTGRVVTEDGEPVRKAGILGRIEAGQLNMTYPWNGFFWAQTDAEGRFKIEGLLAEVKVGASVPAGNLFKDLTLRPGEVRDLGDRKVPSGKQ